MEDSIVLVVGFSNMEDLLYHRSQKVHYESIPFGVSSNNSDFLIGRILLVTLLFF